MADKMNAFLSALSDNAEWKEAFTEKLKGVAPKEQAAAVIAFAAEKGFGISEEDLQDEYKEVDLDELETVAGGGGGCGCITAGVGKGDGLKCGCVVSGYGAIGNTQISSQGGCVCISSGAGATHRH